MLTGPTLRAPVRTEVYPQSGSRPASWDRASVAARRRRHFERRDHGALRLLALPVPLGVDRARAGRRDGLTRGPSAGTWIGFLADTGYPVPDLGRARRLPARRRPGPTAAAAEAPRAVAVAVGLRLAASSGLEGGEEALQARWRRWTDPAGVRARGGRRQSLRRRWALISRHAPGARSEVLLSLVTAVQDRRCGCGWTTNAWADGERFERQLEPRRVLSMEELVPLAWDLEAGGLAHLPPGPHTVSTSTHTDPQPPVPNIEAAGAAVDHLSAYPTACTVRILAPYDRSHPASRHAPARSRPTGEILRAPRRRRQP